MGKFKKFRYLIPAFTFYLTTLIFLQIAMGQQEHKLFEEDQCIVCHTEEDILPENFSENDIHLQVGLSCAGCHGGDPASDDMDESMDPESGFVGVPSKDEIPRFCGKCHSDINTMRQFQPRISTDQVEQYYTSVHGKKLLSGDEKVADCTSCHSSHEILPASDPRSTTYAENIPATCNHCHGDTEYMKKYGIATNQYEEFKESVHGIALLDNHDTGSPACNDCHGNHGATPPGVASVSHVCGICHVNNLEYFSETRMAEEFQKQGIHGCEECHGNHAVNKTFDKMVGVGAQSVCIDCHEKGDTGYNVAKNMYLQIENLVSRYDSASVKLEEVQKRGMDDVEISYLLQEANQNLIKTRTLVHTFDLGKVSSETEKGIQKADQAIGLITKEIRDFNVRRRGFGIATVFITILVIALFFKIREIEKKE